jgi:hypothetical protein
MLLAAILLLCPNPQIVDAAKVTATLSAGVSSNSTNDSSLWQHMPSVPEPKVKTDAEVAAGSGAGTTVAVLAPTAAIVPAATIQPGRAPMSIAAVKPVVARPRETAEQRRLWYVLSFAGSGAAGFDAWSTRRAITQGYGVEGNPMLRPFSHSGALYGATQVSPLMMDFIGKRMMVSQHKLIRKMWWLPQAAGSGVSVAAGVHNMRLVP